MERRRIAGSRQDNHCPKDENIQAGLILFETLATRWGRVLPLLCPCGRARRVHDAGGETIIVMMTMMRSLRDGQQLWEEVEMTLNEMKDSLTRSCRRLQKGSCIQLSVVLLGTAWNRLRNSMGKGAPPFFPGSVPFSMQAVKVGRDN